MTLEMALLKTPGRVLSTAPRRQFHASLLRLKQEDEEYEIDLITLKKRPKWKKKEEKTKLKTEPFDDLLFPDKLEQKGKDKSLDKMKDTLFDDAIKFVQQDKLNKMKKIEVNMPPRDKQSAGQEQDGDEIINVQKPKIVHREPSSPATHHNFVSETPMDQTQHRIQDIMKLVSQEVPELSNEAQKLADDIENNIARMKEIRAMIQEAEQREQEALNKFTKDGTPDIKRENLESFLTDAKRSKDRNDEHHFREQRRFEWSLQSSRSLRKKNFFTPIDEKLIRSVKKSNIPRLNHTTDDLLFPSLPKLSNSENMSHEFLVQVNGKQIITKENPFGPHYLPPDLVSIFHQIGNVKPHMRAINRLEKQKWRLIGTQNLGDTRVLVFERYINEIKEKKERRTRLFKIWSLLALGSFATLYTIGFLLENEQRGAKWSIDKDGELVKKS